MSVIRGGCVAILVALEWTCGGESPATSAARTPAPPAVVGGSPVGMLRLEGGEFDMGTEDGFAYEAPIRRMSVAPFWIDAHEVSVAQFRSFVSSTGHVTTAETLGWSGAFDPARREWLRVDGADWLHPDGPASTAGDDEPVTQVSWDDARAFAAWSKKRLPTEVEFEFALRGGHARGRYAWGVELVPNGVHRANLWQGEFPLIDLGADGHRSRAPVGSYPANDFGLYDMVGNVWEWCEDRFVPYGRSATPTDTARVIRGGSWLCAPNYCEGYRAAARNQTEPDSGLNNLGFRCVMSDS